MRVKETIKIKINGKEIPIIHDGINAYKNWNKGSKEALREWVTELLDKDKAEGWLPFANFEASVSFNLNTKTNN